MKLTFHDLENYTAFYKNIADKELNFQTAYTLSRIMRMTDTEIKFFNDKLSHIIDQYGQRDEQNNFVYNENGNIMIKPEYIEECTKMITELYAVDIECDDMYLDARDLVDLKITPQVATALLPFIKKETHN